jgi:PBP1b-binding outer membrane lipoprotein LpoB
MQLTTIWKSYSLLILWAFVFGGCKQQTTKQTAGGFTYKPVKWIVLIPISIIGW